MNHIYKKLMEQHGGSIPFTLLGGVQTELEKKNKTVRRRKQSSKRRSKTKQRRRNRLNPQNYSVGTIIRSNGQLMKLSPNKQWLTI
jgi:hypothetical protein